MAAHLEGKGAGEMEMAGLAQKGGAVHIHVRIADRPSDISAIRVAVGEADALIGGDLVVSAGAKTLGLTARGRTRAVVNAHEITTGDFTRDRSFHLPTDRLTLALRARLGEDGLTMLDATRLAEQLLGDAIYANVLMLGAAWQAGLVPLSAEAIARAIDLNGAGAEGNHAAFAIGRWAVASPRDAAARLAPPPAPPADDLDTIVERRAAHLAQYQGKRLARRYRARIAAAAAVDPDFAKAMAQGLPQAPRLQGRVRGRPPPRRDHPRGRRRRLHRRPGPALPPRAAHLGGTRRRRPAAKAQLRPVDALAPSACCGASASCAERRSTPSATPPSGAWSGS